MNTLILILLGIITSLLVSKSQHQKYRDIIMGTLGALAASAAISSLGLPALNSNFAFLIPVAGAVAAIHSAHLLENLPKSSFSNKAF